MVMSGAQGTLACPELMLWCGNAVDWRSGHRVVPKDLHLLGVITIGQARIAGPTRTDASGGHGTNSPVLYQYHRPPP